MTMRYLSDLNMPALPRGDRRSTLLLARIVLLEERPAELAHLQLATSFLRTVEFAGAAYRMAKNRLEAFSKTRVVGGLFEGISGLETCLAETHRAVRFGDALSRAHITMHDGAPVVPRSARSSVLSARTAHRIAQLRHALQHLEDRIIEGELDSSQALGPRPEATLFRVGRLGVSYADLVSWIVQLDIIASRVQQITRPAARNES